MSFTEKYKSPQNEQSQYDQPNQRIVGLPKRHVKPLLQFIKGRPRDTTTKPIINLHVATMVADDDPPLSSSDDEQPSRADIRPTAFASKKNLTSSDSAASRLSAKSTNDKTRSSARTKPETKSPPASSASKELSEVEDDENKPNRKRKSPSQEQTGADEIPRQWNRFPPSKTYKKTKTVRVPRMIQKYEGQDDSPGKKKLMIPKESSTKQELTPSPAKKELFVPGGGHRSPTNGSPLGNRLEKPSDRKGPKIPDSPEESRPKFFIPELLPHMKEEDHDGYDMARINTIDVSRSMSPLSDIDSPTSSVPVCPMCSEEVDETVLRKFKKIHPGLRMTLRQEQLFCVFHKKRSAKRIWRKKRFPEIDWKGLDKRIAKHHKFLRAILEGGESHYGNIFSQKIKSGQNRTLLKSEDDLNPSPGYYGARGLRAMTDNLTWKFSSLLRERSVKDRLVSARGHTAYVQAVLVPELAVQLIKDDMGVDVEKARVIMEESISVGELLSEEVGDIVVESDESDKGM